MLKQSVTMSTAEVIVYKQRGGGVVVIKFDRNNCMRRTEAICYEIKTGTHGSDVKSYEMGLDLAVSQCPTDNKSKSDSRTSRNMGLKMDFKT